MRGRSLELGITRDALKPLVTTCRAYLDPRATVLATVVTFGFPCRQTLPDLATHRSFHLTDEPVYLSALMITTEQSSLQWVLIHPREPFTFLWSCPVQRLPPMGSTPARVCLPASFRLLSG